MSASTQTRSPACTPQRLGGDVADLGDAADGLVAGNDGKAHRERTLVLLVVGTADAAGLDLEQRVVSADLGQWQLAHLEGAGAGLDDGAGGASHYGRRSGRCTPLAYEPGVRLGLTNRSSMTASASRTMSRTISAAGLISWIIPTPWPAGMNVLLTSKNSVRPG